MTIKDFHDMLIAVGSNKANNNHFRKEYIFIFHTIDHTYNDMIDKYILYVLNVTKNKFLTMENIDKFRKELETYHDTDTIEITYDDTIEIADGVKINLKTDKIYKQIKETMRKDIDVVIKWKTDNMKAKLIAKSQGSRHTFKMAQMGGKRKSRRKSRTMKTHHRKTRSH